jgi:membrane protein YdbS with pleckstrin-like domain
MEKESDVIWRGRPWIGPPLAIRTVLAIALGFVLLAALSGLGLLASALLGVPLYVWTLAIVALGWLASALGLVAMRASRRYALRRGSIEVDEGIVSKKSLVVSPSAFSELEVDQGIMGRILDYGTLQVRSQGGQRLVLRLIRDPKGVSARVRDVMTVPEVRIARDDQSGPQPSG